MEDFEALINEAKMEIEKDTTMNENEVMTTIFDIAKKNTPKLTKKQEKNEEAKQIMRERLKNAREKKKTLTDKLKELEELLKQKNENDNKSTPIEKVEPVIEPPKPIEKIEPVIELPKPIETVEPVVEPPKPIEKIEPVIELPKPIIHIEPTKEEIAKKIYDNHLINYYNKLHYRKNFNV
jgi:hypothetical protein